MDDLEATFAIDNTPASSSQLVKSPSQKQNVTTLLDITRANHIGNMSIDLRGRLSLTLCSYYAFPN